LKNGKETVQKHQTSMVNLSSGWFLEFVRGEVDFHSCLVLIHNLALEYRRQSISVQEEMASAAATRTAKAALFSNKYAACQGRLVAEVRKRWTM
jgi:hypothetical protein